MMPLWTTENCHDGSDLCLLLSVTAPDEHEVQNLPVGLAIESGRRTVGSPSGVCNACVRIKDLGEIWLLVLNELLELCHLADLLESENLVLLVSIYGQTSRVVATVFETGEAIDESIENELSILFHQVI